MCVVHVHVHSALLRAPDRHPLPEQLEALVAAHGSRAALPSHGQVEQRDGLAPLHVVLCSRLGRLQAAAQRRLEGGLSDPHATRLG